MDSRSTGGQFDVKVMRSALVQLVHDALLDKPKDVAAFMEQWARNRIKERQQERLNANIATAAPVMYESCTSKVCAITSEVEAVETRKAAMEIDPDAPPLTVEESLEAVRDLGARQLRHLHDLADGAKDHYMMALEDSDWDLGTLRDLEKEMHDARASEVAMRDEVDAMEKEAASIVEDPSIIPSTRAKQIYALYMARVPRWELPPRH